MPPDSSIIVAGGTPRSLVINNVAWSLVNGQVAVNGVPDPTTGRVTELAYQGGLIWQRNADNLWWSKASPADPWQPPYGTAVSPVPPSPDNTILLTPGYAITDAAGNAWSILDGQVVVNGVPDATTGRVIELAYENGRVWQQNADHLWWGKAAPSDTWSPTYGTPDSPEGPTARTWLTATGSYDDPANWSPYGVPRTGDTVSLVGGQQSRPIVMAMNNSSPAAGLTITTVDNGTPNTMNLSGQVVNGATIRDVFGALDVNVGAAGILVNNGVLAAQGGIANAILNISLSDGSALTNTGTINALAASRIPTFGTVAITGGSTSSFSNQGLIAVGQGTLDVDLKSDWTNAGSVVIGSGGNAALQFGDYGATRHLVNTGVIEVNGNAHVQIAAPRAYETYFGSVQNDGTLSANGGTLEVAAPLQQNDAGAIDITGGGTVTLDGAADGGSIQITDGMLAFGGGSRVTYGPTAARAFNATLSFIGNTGTLQFGENNVTEVFQAVADSQAELLVYTNYFSGDHRPLADIHLAGRYTADEFSASGSTVNFVAHQV